MKLYMLLEYSNADEDSGPYPVGIFSSEEKATMVATELVEEAGDEYSYSYFIHEYDLDTAYFRSEEEAKQNEEDSLERMVNMGFIDYEIDENGEFVFHITDSGRSLLDQ